MEGDKSKQEHVIERTIIVGFKDWVTVEVKRGGKRDSNHNSEK